MVIFQENVSFDHCFGTYPNALNSPGDDALKAGNLPAVSYLKSAAYRDGHSGYSDPLDEQKFLVHLINTLAQTPEWTNTLVIVTYADSDGWYDHVSNLVNLYAGLVGVCLLRDAHESS